MKFKITQQEFNDIMIVTNIKTIQGQRKGQAIMNAIGEVRLDIYHAITGTDKDIFYCETPSILNSFFVKHFDIEWLMEKGTKLICVDNEGAESSLTLGKVYTVKDELRVSKCVCVDCDCGFVNYFWPERFEVLEGDKPN